MKTMKQFAASCHAPCFARAVIRQVGGWQEFQEIAEDVARHGATAGWVGFTWYTDTVKFARKNKKAIIEKLQQDYREFGYNSLVESVMAFNCLKGEEEGIIAKALYGRYSDECTQVYNALAWYALEETCRAYCNVKESE